MTRWIQPVRIVPNEEVAQHIADIYNNENSDNLRMYWNTINPDVLPVLDRLGVPIDPYGSPNYLTNHNTDRFGNKIPQELFDLRAAEKGYKDILKKAKDAKTEATYNKHMANAHAYYQDILSPAMDALNEVENETGVRSKPKFTSEVLDARALADNESEETDSNGNNDSTRFSVGGREPDANENALREELGKIRGGTFFSGGGTVDFALAEILHSMFAVEYDPKISAVYQKNNKTEFMGENVLTFDPTKWKGKLDWFHASPVCKTYSHAITAKGKENREKSGIDYATAERTANALRVIQPKAFTLENVIGYRNSEPLQLIKDALNELGYTWDEGVYNSADFGAATSRDRYFIRAVKDGKLPAIKKSTSKTTWYDAVSDMVDTLPEAKTINPRMIENLKNISGIDVNNITQPLLVFGESYKNKEYGHAFADSVAPTIIANSGASRIFMPDGRVLEATPEVLARISGLPKEYELPKEVTRARTIVGNGVPVKLTQGVIGGLLKENFDVNPTKFSKGGRNSVENLNAGRYNEVILPSQTYAMVQSVIMSKYANHTPNDGSIALGDKNYFFRLDSDGKPLIVRVVDTQLVDTVYDDLIRENANDLRGSKNNSKKILEGDQRHGRSGEDIGVGSRGSEEYTPAGGVVGRAGKNTDSKSGLSSSRLTGNRLNNLYRKLFTDADMPHEANDIKNYEDNFNRLYAKAISDPSFYKNHGDIADDINAILKATGKRGTLYSKGDRTVEDVTREVLQSNTLEEGMQKLGEYYSETLKDTPPKAETPRDDKARAFAPKVTEREQIDSAAAMQKLIEKYGLMKPGTDKGKVRETPFAKKVNDTSKVRRATQTVTESGLVRDFQADRLRGEVLRNEALSYQTISDKASQQQARELVERRGYEQMLREWEGIASPEHGVITKGDIALGELLLAESAKIDDMATTMRLVADLAEMGTTSGQAVQALSMIKKMTPAGQLYYTQKALDRINKDYSAQISAGKMTPIRVDAELAKAVLEARTQQEVDDAVDALLQDVADHLPVSIMDRWNAWRYLSMLGNPRTWIRNGVGNTVFAPVTFLKDIAKAGIEAGYIKDPNQRTASVKGAMQALSKSGDYYKFATEQADAMRDTLQGNGKYNAKQAILNRKKPLRIGKFDAIQKFSDFTSNILENGTDKIPGGKLLGDWTFLRGHFVSAMTQFLQARNADLSTLYTTREGKQLLNEARQYAVLEAQKATFRDYSAFAQWLSRGAKNKTFGWLVEGLFPFKKTPTNILRRGIEYSPIGLVTAGINRFTKVKSGEMTANEWCDQLASGLTGTVLMGVGLLLANLGILRGSGDEDDKQKNFDTLKGYQNYSLQLGDVSYTIDWMAPSALPLFLGVEVQKLMSSDDGITGANMLDALTLIAEPMFSLSMLDGLNSTITSAGYSDSPLSAIFLSTMMSYLGQGMPTLLGQAARSIEPNQKTTYINKNSPVPEFLQRFWQQTIAAKIPFVYGNKADKIDAWGRTNTTENAILRTLENFLSPGYANLVQTTAVDDALQKLADDTGDTSILPTTATKKFTIGGETKNLTAEEYETYAKTRGQTAYQLLQTAITDATWEAMDDKMKTELVSKIYTYSTAVAKSAVAGEYEEAAWIANANASGDPFNYILTETLVNDDRNTASTVETIYSMSWLSDATKGNLLKFQFGGDATVTDYSTKGYKFTLDPEWQSYEIELYRSAFDSAYTALISSNQYQSASFADRMELISDMQSEVKKAVRQQISAELKASGAVSEVSSSSEENTVATTITSKLR